MRAPQPPRQLQQGCVEMTIVEKVIGPATAAISRCMHSRALLRSRRFLRTTGSGQRHDEGFIVVAVLWILAALATLAAAYAIYVANTVSGARVHDDRIRRRPWFRLRSS